MRWVTWRAASGWPHLALNLAGIVLHLLLALAAAPLAAHPVPRYLNARIKAYFAKQSNSKARTGRSGAETGRSARPCSQSSYVRPASPMHCFRMSITPRSRAWLVHDLLTVQSDKT